MLYIRIIKPGEPAGGCEMKRAQIFARKALARHTHVWRAGL